MFWILFVTVCRPGGRASVVDFVIVEECIKYTRERSWLYMEKERHEALVATHAKELER